jgi:hypothetical protein
LFWQKQSKPVLLIIALYLSALPIPTAQAGQAGAGQNGARGLPEFVIDKTLHDFGEVFAGEEVQGLFIVNNVGNAPLELSDKPLLATRPTVSLYHRPTGVASLPLLAASAFRPAPV